MLSPRTRSLLALPLLWLGTGAAQADTLLDIYDMALNNDPVLKAAEATFRAGQEYEIQGRAGLLPQVGARAAYGEQRYEQVSPGTNFLGTPTGSDNKVDLQEDDEDYSLNLSQALFDVPAWFVFQQGKQLSLQAEAQFASDQQDLIVRTVEAYVNVLRAIDNLKSSKAEEAAFQRQLEQTQQRFEVGLIAITDVHEARAAYDLSVVNRLTDEGNLGVAYEALSVLTGQRHANLWMLSEEFPIHDPEPAGVEPWVDLALKGNFDLQAANYAAEAALEASQARKWAHLPTLTGQASLVDTSSDTSTDIQKGALAATNPHGQTFNDLQGNSFNIVLDVPLWTGGAISSQRRQAYEEYLAASETRTSVMRNTIQFTRSLHVAVTTDVQRVKARKQSIVSAQSALDATTAGYEVGTRNVVDVLNAQRILYSAIRDYANTRYDFVVRLLRLRRQAGLLSPEDVAELSKWLIEPAAASATQSGTPAT
jgi:outer membrane protein